MDTKGIHNASIIGHRYLIIPQNLIFVIMIAKIIY